MIVTNHKASNHKITFMAAANAIPMNDDGTEQNAPPRTNHQMVTPGCTKLERGLIARITELATYK